MHGIAPRCITMIIYVIISHINYQVPHKMVNHSILHVVGKCGLQGLSLWLRGKYLWTALYVSTTTHKVHNIKGTCTSKTDHR